jgi:hypothetical protein
VDVEDPKFWDQVKIVHPTNHDFWKDIHLTLNNGDIYLDPLNPKDLIKIFAIEAGGFMEVAKSYQDARLRKNAPKFYLDRLEDTAVTLNEWKKVRNKAIALLTELEENPAKMFYVVKVLDPNAYSIKKNTPPDVMYNMLDLFINAEGPETSKKKAAQEFIDVTSYSQEDLILNAMVKDAIFFKFIAAKSDQLIYHIKSNIQLGRNIEECIESLRNPINEKTLGELKKELEKHW